jgi:hypothetical protein
MALSTELGRPKGVSMFQRRMTGAVAGAVCAFVLAAPALADSPTFLKPNLSEATGQQLTAINGHTFSNKGLIAVGRVSAQTHDFNGETIGSFSGMAIRNWTRNADGSYSGVLTTLPDRGPSAVAGQATTDYAARLETFAVTLNGSSLTLKPTGGMLLKDAAGATFTGREPGKAPLTREGVLYPFAPRGQTGTDRISVDPEAISLLADGSFYVGDEYGPMIYYFAADGRQLGVIAPTPAILPKVGGQPNFSAEELPSVGWTGRRPNQGLEGVSVTPDGRRLFAVLQSAALQDDPANTDVQRNTTRVLVYDITKNKTPGQPIGENVLQLPT